MKIVSGGQTGVDRAALDVALELGMECGGWCPAERMAEDGPIDPRYPLRETPSADPAQRTEWNVRDADACLIVVDDGGLDVSAGTALASDLAHRYRKPLFVMKLGNADALKQAPLWLRVQRARHGEGLKLAIGGPRESEAPGIYLRAREFIDELMDAAG